jgi:stage II sporulation protein E
MYALVHVLQRNYQTTLDAMNSLSNKLSSSGTVSVADLPRYFLDECRSAEKLIEAINAQAKAAASRRQFKARLRENRGAAYMQYADVSANKRLRP